MNINAYIYIYNTFTYAYFLQVLNWTFHRNKIDLASIGHLLISLLTELYEVLVDCFELICSLIKIVELLCSMLLLVRVWAGILLW